MRPSVICFLAAIAPAANAQIIRPQSRVLSPAAWASLDVGYLQQGSVDDPGTNSFWNFGSTAQWRVTLEYAIDRSSSIGIAGTLAKVPLTYTSSMPTTTCVQCEADANVSQILASFHYGGGLGFGFHQVIEISAGTTMFSNFRSKAGEKLPPTSPVSDFTFTFGYGFGYDVSPAMTIFAVQDASTMLHRKASSSSNNTVHQFVTRIGIRAGLGEKR